jgi:hypothetical protein
VAEGGKFDRTITLAWLARVKSDRSYCYQIRDPDLRNRCRAETP